ALAQDRAARIRSFRPASAMPSSSQANQFDGFRRAARANAAAALLRSPIWVAITPAATSASSLSGSSDEARFRRENAAAGSARQPASAAATSPAAAHGAAKLSS